jgi:hypothetical protein
MGIDEIRRRNADAFSDFQEAEERVMDLRSELREIGLESTPPARNCCAVFQWCPPMLGHEASRLLDVS